MVPAVPDLAIKVVADGIPLERRQNENIGVTSRKNCILYETNFGQKKLEYYIHAGCPRKFGNKYKYPTPNFVVHPVAKVLGPDNDIFF